MREFAIALAERAGSLLLEFHQSAAAAHDFDVKSSPVDLVTAADVASDHLITAAIRTAFPDHAIYSEESAVGPLPQAEWLWVIDPLDGTTNFADRIPFFGVNIALAHHGVTILGVTHDPIARRGTGPSKAAVPGCALTASTSRCAFRRRMIWDEAS